MINNIIVFLTPGQINLETGDSGESHVTCFRTNYFFFLSLTVMTLHQTKDPYFRWSLCNLPVIPIQSQVQEDSLPHTKPSWLHTTSLVLSRGGYCSSCTDFTRVGQVNIGYHDDPTGFLTMYCSEFHQSSLQLYPPWVGLSLLFRTSKVLNFQNFFLKKLLIMNQESEI